MDRVYSCPTFLSDAGYDLASKDDFSKWKLVRDISALIDELTGQWFNVEYKDWRLDGRGRGLVAHPQGIPFAFVESVTVDAANTNARNASYGAFSTQRTVDQSRHTGYAHTGSLSNTEWVLHKRALERIRLPFPGGAGNVIVAGGLGWVANAHNTKTTSTTEVTAVSTTVTVADVTGFKYRDVLEIVGTNDSVRVIVTQLNRETNTLTFDAVGVRGLPANIAVGAAVRAFGQTPRPIESLANYLLNSQLREGEANAAGQAPIDPARIKRERTDDYEYEFFSSTTKVSMVSGSERYDRILAAFSAPGGVRVI
jgi:hypothetical protein